MSLPYPGMDFTPLDTLPAADLDKMVANIEALASGTGLNDASITPAKLNLTKSVDANGWTVYNFGNWKRYSKRVTYSQTIAAATTTTLGVSSTNLPVGVTNIGTRELQYVNSNNNGFGSDCYVSTDNMNLNTATAFSWAVRNSAATSRAYSGTIDITITER